MPRVAQAKKARAGRAKKDQVEQEQVEVEHSSDEQVQEAALVEPPPTTTNVRGKRTVRSKKDAEAEPVAFETNGSDVGDDQSSEIQTTVKGRKKAAAPKKVVSEVQGTNKSRSRGKKAVVVEVENESSATSEAPVESERAVTKKGKGRQKKAVDEVETNLPQDEMQQEEPETKVKGRVAKPGKKETVPQGKPISKEPKKGKGRGKTAAVPEPVDEEDQVDAPVALELPEEKKKRGGRAKKPVLEVELPLPDHHEPEDEAVEVPPVEEKPQVKQKRGGRAKKAVVEVEKEQETPDSDHDGGDEVVENDELVATPQPVLAAKKKRGKKADVAKETPQSTEPFEDEAELPITAAFSNIETRKKRGISAPTTPVVNSGCNSTVQTPTEEKRTRGRVKKVATLAKSTEDPAEPAAPSENDEMPTTSVAVPANKKTGRGKKAAAKLSSEEDEDETPPIGRKDRKRKDASASESQVAKKSMKQK